MVVDNLSRTVNDEMGGQINESFPNEHIFALSACVW